jgi:hypothetical protein
MMVLLLFVVITVDLGQNLRRFFFDGGKVSHGVVCGHIIGPDQVFWPFI